MGNPHTFSPISFLFPFPCMDELAKKGVTSGDLCTASHARAHPCEKNVLQLATYLQHITPLSPLARPVYTILTDFRKPPPPDSSQGKKRKT
jgi:hypothetical protein